MSADAWKDCPVCNSKESVDMYYVWDYELNKDGSITHDIQGRCKICQQLFTVK